MVYVSQPNSRHFSYTSHDRYFSSQSDNRNYSTLDGPLERESEVKRSRDWSISTAVRHSLHRNLISNPNYTSTVCLPSISFKIRADYYLGTKNVEPMVAEITRLFEKGEDKQALEVFVGVIKGESKWGLEDLKTLEQCLAAQVQTLSLPNTLYALDVFIQIDHSPSLLLGALLRHLSMQWESIEKTPPNIVQLLLLIGLSRNAPDELWHSLEGHLEENISALSAAEISIVSFGFFAANRRIRSSSLTQAMADTLLKELKTSVLNQSWDKFNLHLLANILKAFRHAGYKDLTFYKELGDIICDSTWGLATSYNPLMHIATTYATFGIKHERLLGEIKKKVSVVESNRSTPRTPRIQDPRLPKIYFRSKDLRRLCWSYIQLQMEVPKQWQKALVIQLHNEPTEAR